MRQIIDEVPVIEIDRSYYAIELVSEADPKLSKVYLLLPTEQLELNNFLAENLYTGRIYLSKFLMTIPVFFIKKKDSSLQLV